MGLYLVDVVFYLGDFGGGFGWGDDFGGSCCVVGGLCCVIVGKV